MVQYNDISSMQSFRERAIGYNRVQFILKGYVKKFMQYISCSLMYWAHGYLCEVHDAVSDHGCPTRVTRVACVNALDA